MKTRDMACLLLYVLVLVFICVSCTKTDAQPVPAGEQELPDMEMRNATYTLARGSGEPLVMQAATITIHRGNRGTVLRSVTFRQGSDLSGSADLATVNSDNSRAELSGNVTLVRTGEDGVTVKADNLVWNKEDNSVFCEGEVLVTYGDGTVIRAIGFSGLPDEGLYEFSTILEGRLEK